MSRKKATRPARRRRQERRVAPATPRRARPHEPPEGGPEVSPPDGEARLGDYETRYRVSRGYATSRVIVEP